MKKAESKMLVCVAVATIGLTVNAALPLVKDGKPLAAGRTKGVLNAVYRFLERNSDIIWVRLMQAENGFGTIYGKMRDFKNAVGDLVDVPSFGHHRNWSGGGDWGAGHIYRHQARILNCCDVWWEARDKRDSVLYADCTDLQRHVDFGMGAAIMAGW